MSEFDSQLLAEFELKMRRLMLYCDTLKSENVRLREEITQKVQSVDVLKAENEHLKVKYDNLKFAKSFSNQNEDERMKAKMRLSKLVRDVDKCITILKK